MKRTIKIAVLILWAMSLLALAPRGRFTQEEPISLANNYPFPTSPILGDDLSGDAQLGPEISDWGYRSIIPIKPLTDLPQNTVVLLNSGARPLGAMETYNKTLQIMGSFLWDKNLIPFRMDSTLRGWWMAGLYAALEQTDADLVVIAPALPEEARFTIEGQHFQGQRPIGQIPEYARDIRAPEGRRDIISEVMRHQLVELFKLFGPDQPKFFLRIVKEKPPSFGPHTIEMRKEEFARKLMQLPPKSFVIFDAKSYDDLRFISAVISRCAENKKIIAAGSSGLLKTIIKELYPSQTPLLLNWKDLLKFPYPKRSTLILAGSITPKSFTQIEKAKATLPDEVQEVFLNVNNIFAGGIQQKRELESARRLVLELLKKGKQVILRTTIPPQIDLSASQRLQIANAQAQVIRDKALLSYVSLLAVIGGDTSEAIAHALDAEGVEPIGKADELVPINYFRGGLAEGIPVIIKAGNIGGEAVLADILKTFVEERDHFFNAHPIKVGVTLGDPASADPEITARWFMEFAPASTGTIPIVIGHERYLQNALEAVRAKNPGLDPEGLWRIRRIQDIYDLDFIGIEPHVINLYEPTVDMQGREITMGSPDAASGHLAIAYINASAELIKGGKINLIVNNPISKEATDKAKEAGLDPDWPGVGHTEAYELLLGLEPGKAKGTTMIGTGDLKVFLLQHHVSTWEAYRNLESPEIIPKLLEVIRAADKCLKIYFGISKPRLIVPGPNPHSRSKKKELGGGKNDTRAEDHIEEAIAQAQNEGILVGGPKAANVAFPRGKTGAFDAVISLEHETGHLAVGMAGVEGGRAYPGAIYLVTFGLGNKAIRTSALHGPAEDIAGKGTAIADGLNAAFETGLQLWWAQQERNEVFANQVLPSL